MGVDEIEFWQELHNDGWMLPQLEYGSISDGD